MMTLDEAIKHAEEVAEEKEERIHKTFATFGEDRHLFKEEEHECKKCADEHRQLAEWLKDYKQMKEQQPSDDCVSRQAMLKEIPRLWNSKGDKDYCMETLRDFVSELPPVTPTHKKGKWLISSDYPDRIICSCCDINYDMWFWEQGTMNYCPNCGAEMESEE